MYSQIRGQTNPDHDCYGHTLINSFICETIENAGNVLNDVGNGNRSDNKITLTQENLQALLLKTHDSKYRKSPIAGTFKTVLTSSHTSLKERKTETQKLAQLVINIKHKSN